MEIPELGEMVSPMILETTPDVLSSGYRCAKLGYDFHWPQYAKNPTLTLPSGKRIRGPVKGYIPYIYCTTDDNIEPAMPLTDASAVHEHIMAEVADN